MVRARNTKTGQRYDARSRMRAGSSRVYNPHVHQQGRDVPRRRKDRPGSGAWVDPALRDN